MVMTEQGSVTECEISALSLSSQFLFSKLIKLGFLWLDSILFGKTSNSNVFIFIRVDIICYSQSRCFSSSHVSAQLHTKLYLCINLFNYIVFVSIACHRCTGKPKKKYVFQNIVKMRAHVQNLFLRLILHFSMNSMRTQDLTFNA